MAGSKSRIVAKHTKQAPVPDADGKISFTSSVGSDFLRLMNQMAETGFFTQYSGPLTFYNAAENIYWSDKYTKSSWSNGWAAAKKKSADALFGARDGAAPSDDGTSIMLDI